MPCVSQSVTAQSDALEQTIAISLTLLKKKKKMWWGPGEAIAFPPPGLFRIARLWSQMGMKAGKTLLRNAEMESELPLLGDGDNSWRSSSVVGRKSCAGLCGSMAGHWSPVCTCVQSTCGLFAFPGLTLSGFFCIVFLQAFLKTLKLCQSWSCYSPILSKSFSLGS